MSGLPDWRPGDVLEEIATPPIDRERLRKYAAASGDPNPIHLSDEAAAAAGLPGVIAHGMLTVATMGLLFSPHLDRGHVKTFRSRFSGMVFLGDKIFARWKNGQTQDERFATFGDRVRTLILHAEDLSRTGDV